jgi:hypothetical protein
MKRRRRRNPAGDSTTYWVLVAGVIPLTALAIWSWKAMGSKNQDQVLANK